MSSESASTDKEDIAAFVSYEFPKIPKEGGYLPAQVFMQMRHACIGNYAPSYVSSEGASIHGGPQDGQLVGITAFLQ